MNLNPLQFLGHAKKEKPAKKYKSQAGVYPVIDTVPGNGVGTVGNKFHGYDRDDKSVNY